LPFPQSEPEPCGGAVVEKREDRHVERIVKLHIENLPEGLYLATSDDVPGLVAQGRTIGETLEIARDIARKLIEAQAGETARVDLAPAADACDDPLILNSSEP
jgi:predicted RNase H-like HicB family nuclease